MDLDAEFTSDSFRRQSMFKPLEEEKWRIRRISKQKGYKSILYVNNFKRHVVLAYQGVILEARDFFLDKNNQIEAIFYSVLSNLDVADQSTQAYLDTKEALDLSKETGYSLSFTGYSFGAWLAEQSVFFCHKDFEYSEARAVTFESPGSKDYLDKLSDANVYNKETLFDLTSLDIVTYLSAPNFVNTCNRHVGRVYRVFTDETNMAKETQDFIVKMLDSFPIDLVTSRLKECFIKKIQPHISEYMFYLNGIKSLFSNGLDAFVKSFDKASKNVKHCKNVKDWPKTDFRPSDDFKHRLAKLLDVEAAFDLIPFGEAAPKVIKQLAASVVNFTANKLIDVIAKNCLAGIAVIVNFVLEMFDGNLNEAQCLDCFKWSATDTHASSSHTLFDTTRFKLNYVAHYRIEDLNLSKMELDVVPGTLDFYLWRLNLVENKLGRLKDPAIEHQLAFLIGQYKIEHVHQKYVIKAMAPRGTIEKVKCLLERLLLIDPRLHTFLVEPDTLSPSQSKATSSEMGHKFGDKPLDLFYSGRLSDLTLLAKLLAAEEQNQYVTIRGMSGCGKSSLAIQFGYAHEHDYLIRFVNSAQYLVELTEWGDMFNIKKSDFQLIKEFVARVKRQINEYAIRNGKKILFILDRVESKEDEALAMLSFDFVKSHVKFLVTTCFTDCLGANFEASMHVGPFDEAACLKYIRERKLPSIVATDDEWRETFKEIGFTDPHTNK